MASAKLHIICGNCGSNKFLSFEIEDEAIDHGNYFENDCYIKCGNCGVSHSLSDTLTRRSEEGV